MSKAKALADLIEQTLTEMAGLKTCYDVNDVVATVSHLLAATRLEELQAQPVGEAIEHALGFVTQGMVIAYENGLRECGYDPVATLRAALTASPPVVEREQGSRQAIIRIVIDAITEAKTDGGLAVPAGKAREAKLSHLSVIPVRGHPEKHAVFDAIMGDAIAVCPDEIAAQRVFDALTKADAILALTPVEGVGERKTGWLIERDDAQGLLYRTASRFDRDHMKALRFARQEDAQAFCDAFLTDHRHTVAHPQYTRIAEHAWD